MAKCLQFLIALALLCPLPALRAAEPFMSSRRPKLSVQGPRTNQLSRSHIEMRDLLRSKAVGGVEGYSYVSLIPVVANDLNTRTNLGLNNFSTDSIVHGSNPDANVLVELYDTQGNLAALATYVVRSNELRQILNIIPALGSNISVGWLLIFSDEPVTAWASVIDNTTNDPSIELAIADQIGKPESFLESTGTRLMIQSTTRTGNFRSTLSVVNVGSDDCLLLIKIYDVQGNLIDNKTSFVPTNGIYVDGDIRNNVNDTFGPIVIEATDPNPNNNNRPRIIANSLVRSTSQTGGFFPAYALPQANSVSVAGIWEGTIAGGTLINAQVTLTLFQERDMLYGTIDINSGTFPTLYRGFSISGEVSDFHNFQISDFLDQDGTFLVYRFIGSLQNGHLIGDTLYFDEKNRSTIGTFDLTRTGAIYPP